MVKLIVALSSIMLAVALCACGSDSSTADYRIAPGDKPQIEDLHQFPVRSWPHHLIDPPIAPDRNELLT